MIGSGRCSTRDCAWSMAGCEAVTSTQRRSLRGRVSTGSGRRGPQSLQRVEVEYVGVRVGCADDLLAWGRGCRVGRGAPEGRGRAGGNVSMRGVGRLQQGHVRGAVCVQGSDVLATPDIVMYLRLVVWRHTNRPAPFPSDVSANIVHGACLAEKGQTCCCFLDAMAEWVWRECVSTTPRCEGPELQVARPWRCCSCPIHPSRLPRQAPPTLARLPVASPLPTSASLFFLHSQLHPRGSRQSLQLADGRFTLTRSRNPTFALIFFSSTAEASDQGSALDTHLLGATLIQVIL